MSGEISANPRRIIWVKWIDPYIAAVQEHKDAGWLDSYAYLERPGQIGVYSGPGVMGPAGLIPLNELNSPSKNFNLWVGHASFDLDKPTLTRMMRVPGVEILRVWTRYRFWLGVARAFEADAVKAGVFHASAVPVPPSIPEGPLPSPETPAGLKALGKHLSQRWKFWAICKTKSDKIQLVTCNEKAEVENVLQASKDNLKNVLTSWDETDGL